MKLTQLAVITLDTLTQSVDYDTKIDILENAFLEVLQIERNSQLAACKEGVSGVLETENDSIHGGDKKMA